MRRTARPLVTVVVGHLEVGGTEKHLTQVLPRLAAVGLGVEVFLLKDRGELIPVMEASGVPVVRMRRHGPGVAGVMQAAAGLAEYLWRQRPNIVHFFLPEAYLIGATVSLTGPRMLRMMSRRSLNVYQRKRPGSRWWEARLHRRMDAVLGNSRAVARELLQEGVEPRKLGLLYNGVDVELAQQGEKRSEIRARYGLRPGQLAIAAVANLIPYKGYEDLLDALARVAGNLPADWRLLVAGRDCGVRPQLEARANRLGIADHIVWLGRWKDVPGLLRASDVFVQASHQEGFSNSLLEAMAAGCPPLVTDVGGNAEAVLHRRTGLVVPARNPVRLGEALVELARNARAREAYAKAAQARALERFSLPECVERYRRLYENALAGSPVPVSELLPYDPYVSGG